MFISIMCQQVKKLSNDINFHLIKKIIQGLKTFHFFFRKNKFK